MSSIARNRSVAVDAAKRIAIIIAMFAAAGSIGYGVIAIGSGRAAQTLGIGVFIAVVLAMASAVLLELPVVRFVRFAFISTFFFKADLNLFKVNELEDPSGLNISLSVVLALVLIAYEYFYGQEVGKGISRVFAYSAAFLLLIASISVLYSRGEALGIFSLVSLVSSFIIALAIASHFSDRERLIDLLVGIGVGIGFTGITAIAQYTVEFPTSLPALGTGTEEELLGTQSQLLSRVPAFLRTPTEMAWVVSSLFPIVLAPLLCRVKTLLSWQRILLIASIAAGSAAVILSLARGSWIGIVFASIIVTVTSWFVLSFNERRQFTLSVGLGSILLVIVLLPFAGRIYERISSDDQGSALIRVPLMENAIRMIEANPLVGVGLSGYRTYMTKYDETGMFVSEAFPNPVHNVFAHITSEIGIPGGLVFVLLILICLYECFKLGFDHDILVAAIAIGLAAGFVAFIISAMKEPGSLGSVRPPLRTLFLMFGVVFALRALAVRSRTRGVAK